MDDRTISPNELVIVGQNIEEKNFWINKLSGELVKSNFHYDNIPQKNNQRQPDKKHFSFTGEMFNRINQLSNQSDLRLHMILVAGLVVLIEKYTGNKDIIIGAPVYKQDREVKFLNTVLVLRNPIHNMMTFKNLLMQVRQTITEATQHVNYPLEILAEHLNLQLPENGDSPFFDISILLESIHDKQYIQHINHNVTFSFIKKENRLEGVVEYNSSLYLKESIERIITHFTTIFKQALLDVNLKLSQIEIVSDKEKRQLLYEFNNTRSQYPREKTIHELFEEQVERRPEKKAVYSPIDINDIYDQLESAAIDPHLEEKMETCCFKQNSYVCQYPFKLPGYPGSLNILKTNHHNSVIVNNNLARLIEIFDGKRNLKSIYRQVKDLKDKGVKFLIYSMSMADLLEVTFQFSSEPEVFLIDRFESFMKLVQTLYRNHLIELFGINKAEVSIPGSIAERFKPEQVLSGEISIEKLLRKDKEVPKARVLLLGDTPGTASTGLLYLGSYLVRGGINAGCRFYDAGRNYTDMKQEIETLLEDLQPGMVAVSMKWFLYIARVMDMCEIVKQYAGKNSRDIKVIVGGNTDSYYWENIITSDYIDVLIRGDGEEPLLKICRGEDIASIPNCVYKKEGKIIENPITYIQDESNSPGIYLSHLDEILLAPQASRFGTFFIYTHKGCSMNCLYCGGCNRVQQQAFNRKHVFKRGVREVRKDIMEAKTYASTFQFEFDIPDKNLQDYCRQIWEGIDLSNHFCIFSALTAPSAELVQLVSETFKYVYWDFDICTPSERHRKQLFSLGLVKPQPSDENIMNFLQQWEKYNNIEVRLNLITGLPYFTPEDIAPGEQLLNKIINTYSCLGELHWARLHAQPGAPIVADAKKHHMHSFAVTFEDFLKYSRENFNRTSGYSTVEDFNYPFIYFNDEKLNSIVTNFYLEINKKVNQYRKDRQRSLMAANSLSYLELNEKAHQISNALKAKGVGPGKIVGLMLERTIEITTGILAIFKAGCAYLPIDPEFPLGRIEYMLNDSNAKALVTTGKLAEEDEKFRSLEVKKSHETIFIDTLDATNPSSSHLLNFSTSPSSLAYVIYTSGTTGKPKGTLLTHENVVNYVHWFTKEANLTETDKTVLTSSFAFDLGYTSLYTSFLNGCELHILPREIYLSGGRLLDYIGQKGITYIKVTPSLFSVIVNSPNFSMKTCKSLKMAAIGGEAINVDDLEKARHVCPHLGIMNHYGPTEATIGCVAALIDFNRFDEYKKHPVIGKPIYNTRVYILNENSNLQPIGVPGELCISGTCLARGYLNRPELTFERFCLRRPGAPFEKTAPGPHKNFLLKGSHKDHMQSCNHAAMPLSSYLSSRYPIYHTGDLARWLLDGNIEFLGRIDQQVKIRGYRIELEEIESRLMKHKQVEEALVVVKEKEDKENNYICAYIVPKKGEIRDAGQPTNITKKDNFANSPQDFPECKKEDIHQSIIRRFENRVKKDGDKIAVKSNDDSLTYDALNNYANRIAHTIAEEYDDRYRLSGSERQRYKRQMLLHGWGLASQEKLKSTTVFVAGAGGGGSPTIMQLALLGFGTIKVCDFDEIELSNLNRQFLHDEERLGMNKALSAKSTANRINPNLNVIPITNKLTHENVFELVGDAAIIFDMFDGPADKFILSRCAVVKQIPHVIISMADINAYTTVLHTPHTPCYHCIFSKEKFDTITAGMKSLVENYKKNPLAVAATSLFVSTGTAINEVLKILLGLEKPAYNKFFYFNQRGGSEGLRYTPSYQSMTHLFSDHFRRLCKDQGFDWELGWRGNLLEVLDITPDPKCPLCSDNGKETRKILEEQMKKNREVPISIEIKEEETEKKKNKQKTAALLLNPDIEMAAGLVGVLKSGKTYVPFDPASSMQRLSHMLEDSEARIILTDNRHFELAEKLRNKVNKNVKVININQINELEESGEKFNPENLDIEIESRYPAYILFPTEGADKGTPGFNESVRELHNALLKRDSTYTFGIKGYREETSSTPLSRKLRDYLSDQLPAYMIPAFFVQLDRIPLTPNGKADKKMLPDPEKQQEKVSADDYAAPRNEVEEKLSEIWANILEIEKDKVSIDANFFELGGHSLRATTLIAKMHSEFDFRMPLNQIFQYPTIKQISKLILTADLINKQEMDANYQEVEEIVL